MCVAAALAESRLSVSASIYLVGDITTDFTQREINGRGKEREGQERKAKQNTEHYYNLLLILLHL